MVVRVVSLSICVKSAYVDARAMMLAAIAHMRSPRPSTPSRTHRTAGTTKPVTIAGFQRTRVIVLAGTRR